MSTVPAEPAGAVAVICVDEFTVKELVLIPPNLTSVAPVKLLPVMTTVEPPAVEPLLGDTEDTVGAGAAMVMSKRLPALLPLCAAYIVEVPLAIKVTVMIVPTATEDSVLLA